MKYILIGVNVFAVIIFIALLVKNYGVKKTIKLIGTRITDIISDDFKKQIFEEIKKAIKEKKFNSNDGFVKFLIGALKELPYETLKEDYIKNYESFKEKRCTKEVEKNFNDIIDFLNSLNGENIYDSVNIYLESCGLTQKEIEKLKKII